jgi:hypothetical protein
MPEHAEATESACESGHLIGLGAVAAAALARQSAQEKSRTRRAEACGHGVSEKLRILARAPY